MSYTSRKKEDFQPRAFNVIPSLTKQNNYGGWNEGTRSRSSISIAAQGFDQTVKLSLNGNVPTLMKKKPLSCYSLASQQTGIGRSKSFGGLLSSVKSIGGSLSSSSPRSGNWNGGVLGAGYGSPGVPKKLMNSLTTLTSHGNGNGSSPYNGSLSTHHSFTTSNFGSMKNLAAHQMPKHPRPNKTRACLSALVPGIRAYIKDAEDDMSQLKLSISELNLYSNQSSKCSERHLKRLEYQLSRIEELSEKYSHQQRMREGVRAMACAYSESNGKEKEQALAQVKAGFKECTDAMCSLEAQLEPFIGSFDMEMKEIQGFSRLCPGDVFEITIKHGSQKWKSKAKVGKEGRQTWENPRTVLKGLLGEVIFIKAAEVKTLGKQILLGNKFCEITELFSSHAQLMTVNLNPSGSLKLQVVVTWNPLEMMEEWNSIARMNSISSSPSRKRRTSPNGLHLRDSRTGSSSPSLDSQERLSSLTSSSKLNQNGLSSLLPSSETRSDNLVADGKKEPCDFDAMNVHESEEEEGSEKIEGGKLEKSGIYDSQKNTRFLDDGRPMKLTTFMSINKGKRGSREGESEGRCKAVPGPKSPIAQDKVSSAEHVGGLALERNRNEKVQSQSVNDTEQIFSDPSGNFSFGSKNMRKSETGNAQGKSSFPPHHKSRRRKSSDEQNQHHHQLDMIDEDHTMDTSGDSSGHYDYLKEWQSLDESVGRLSSLLEDVQGQYPELESLALHLTSLKKLIEDVPVVAPSSSSSSLNVESALECFDFLDLVNVTEEVGGGERSRGGNEHHQSKRVGVSDCYTPSFIGVTGTGEVEGQVGHRVLGSNENGNDEVANHQFQNPIFNSRYQLHRSPKDIIDPKMTARTTDSGISSIGNGLGSRSPSPTRSSPVQPGRSMNDLANENSEIDRALEVHVSRCIRLLGCLGSFGPLKVKEKNAVRKLKQEGVILGTILKRIKNGATSLSPFSELESLPHLQTLWERIVAVDRSNGSVLCVTGGQAAYEIEREIQSAIVAKYPDEKLLPCRVSKLLVKNMMDDKEFNSEGILTIYQFAAYLRPHEYSFEKLIEELAEEEMLLCNFLEETGSLKKQINDLDTNILPPKSVLSCVICLLRDEENGDSARDYLEAVVKSKPLRRQVIDCAKEMLEYEALEDRQSGIICLELLKVPEAAELLGYLAQGDKSSEVRATARQSLSLIGEDGNALYRKLTLSNHGFQGLAVN